MMTKSPVLFLVFNRPDTSRQVFESIRAARPTRLYVAADGPRPHRPGEAQRCADVRRIATSVDWPCEVKTLFRDQNLGCKVAVATAIDWFFSEESEGIILEDDILPIPTFFRYCDELLERYRNDSRVMMVSGCNLIAQRFKAADSYFFSRQTHIWGWASWRRAWKHYDPAMSEWPRWRNDGLRRASEGDRHFQAYWRAIFDATYRGDIDTWDYQWTFACWRQGGLTALPTVNQTFNLGFGADATHTTGGAPDYVLESRPEALAFPLRHPQHVLRVPHADRIIERRAFGIGPAGTLKLKLRALPVIGNIAKSTLGLLRAAMRQAGLR